MDLIALENFDEEQEQTSYRKLRKRKYWFIYTKKSEDDNRLNDSKDNTPAHIILKTDDLICEKTKNQTNLDVGLSRFIRSKGNLDVASKIFGPFAFSVIKSLIWVGVLSW